MWNQMLVNQANKFVRLLPNKLIARTNTLKIIVEYILDIHNLSLSLCLSVCLSLSLSVSLSPSVSLSLCLSLSLTLSLSLSLFLSFSLSLSQNNIERAVF